VTKAPSAVQSATHAASLENRRPETGPLPVRCWVCGGAEVKSWKRGADRALDPDDLRITDSRYGLTLDLVRCVRCGFVFAPGARGDDILRLYSRMRDDDYARGGHARLVQMRRLLGRALRKRPGATSLLDVGAGTGLLVAAALERGIDAVGVEPSQHAVELGRARVGDRRLLEGTLPHAALAGRRFDLVFLVDVIEHACRPVELLREAQRVLAQGGLVVVATPDVMSVPARLLGDRWWHYRLAHVGYFDAQTFATAARRAGLAIEGAERAIWYFEIGYLAARVEQYLPVHRLNQGARSLAAARRLGHVIVPVPATDSWVFHLAASS
jgi:SAM-dependent methyltransferase